MQEIKLALLGYGNAGRAFGKLLSDKSNEIEKRYHRKVKVTAIVTKSRGTLVNPDGIDLSRIKDGLLAQGLFAGEDSGKALDALTVAREADYDVLLELTPLDIFSGEPAISHIKAAFERRKHVITANKGPIAWKFSELSAMAKERGSLFYYETTVMDGTPVFNLVADTLKMCRILEINGVLNTTTNFVLEEMANGAKLDTILEKGKQRGFVEADPSMDLSGWDSAAKTAALMNVLMDARITPLSIEREGIKGITHDMIADAARQGKRYKLLCNGKIINGKAEGRVCPILVDHGSLFASVSGTSSVVSITTDLMGTITIVEQDPEIGQTAYGIFSDLLRVLDHIQ